MFLGPRGPLGLPSSVRLSARGAKNLDQLYSSSKDHCQPSRHCLVHVWWCLVAANLLLLRMR